MTSSSPRVPVDIFLTVTYEKDEDFKDHLLTEAAIYITHTSDKSIVNGDYANLNEMESNSERIRKLDRTLERILYKKEIDVKVVYVYGDNKIFHKLRSLRFPGIRVIDVKTFHDLNLFNNYYVNLNQDTVVRKMKEYPENRYTMQSLINLCGLIAQDYVLRYSEKEKKLFPGQRVNANLPMCSHYGRVNIFRVILYNYVTYLLVNKYSTNFIEPLLQQILLDMFYPDYYNFSLYPDIYFDKDKVDEAHDEIMALESNIKTNMVNKCIYHRGGLK